MCLRGCFLRVSMEDSFGERVWHILTEVAFPDQVQTYRFQVGFVAGGRRRPVQPHGVLRGTTTAAQG